jgi:hypothetical protein
MVKVLQIIAVGLATTTLAVVTGCSQASAPDAEAPAQQTSDSATAGSTATTPNEGNGTESDRAAGAENAYRTVDNVAFPAPGPDPLAMAFSLRQFTGEEIGSEQMKVTYPTPDQAIVVTTVRGLPDDSVSALRTRYEFKAVEGEAGKWQMVSVSQQNKCQTGRGSEDWTAELCN